MLRRSKAISTLSIVIVWGLIMQVKVIAAVSIFALLATNGATAEEYSVLRSGRPEGAMTVTAQGLERSIAYGFNDRGRGPDIRQTVRVDERGIVQSITSKGVNYQKASVEENFSVSEGIARWTSGADTGSGPARGYYVTYDGTPENEAALLRAVLKAPGANLELLPSGEASARKLLVRSISAAGGAHETVTLYALDGINHGPRLIWLDDGNELFFAGGSWLATIRKGWEHAVDELIATQAEALLASEVETAKALTKRSAMPVAIHNANLFDAAARRMRPGSTVLWRGNRIEAVGLDGGVAIPADAERIDARGRALLPGLWDMHVHMVGNHHGLLHLAGGVTSVRDLANDTDELMARKKRFDEGQLIGPRVVLAGFIDGPGPLAGPTKVLVSTPDEMRAAVNRYADLGYEQIKLYSSVKPELLPVAVETAHARGLRVSGHIPAGMIAAEAVALGFDEIQHANFVLLNFFPDLADETASMRRFTDVGDRASSLDLDREEVRTFLAQLKAKNIVVDPTVAVFEGMFASAPREPDPSLAAIVHRLPPTVARSKFGGGLAKTDAQRAQYRALLCQDAGDSRRFAQGGCSDRSRHRWPGGLPPPPGTGALGRGRNPQPRHPSRGDARIGGGDEA